MPTKRTGRKRRNGEGSITQRSDGRWEVRVTDASGKRKSFYGKKFEDASQILHDAQTSIRQGLPLATGSTSCEEYFGQWLESIKPSLRIRTWERYEGLVRNHLVPLAGRKKLHRLTASDIQTAINEAMAKGLSPLTVKQLYVVINKGLKMAASWGLLPRNPAEHVILPRVDKKQVEMIQPKAIKELFAKASEDRHYPLLVLMATTGARVGELLALRWEDIDLDGGTINIEHTLENSRTNGIKLAPTKTEKSRRQIPVPPIAVQALRSHRADQNERRLRLGDVYNSEIDFVFATEIGTGINHSNLNNRWWKPLVISVGLSKSTRMHHLRHSVASIALHENVPGTTVSAMLGHSNTATTYRIYSHALPDSLRQASDMLADALLGRVADNRD
jgi:integrase